MHFLGEEDEFAWVLDCNVVPITAPNLLVFGRGDISEAGFLISMQKAFREQLFVCPHHECGHLFNTFESVQNHYNSRHCGNSDKNLNNCNKESVEKASNKFLSTCTSKIKRAVKKSIPKGKGKPVLAKKSCIEYTKLFGLPESDIPREWFESVEAQQNDDGPEDASAKDSDITQGS